MKLNIPRFRPFGTLFGHTVFNVAWFLWRLAVARPSRTRCTPRPWRASSRWRACAALRAASLNVSEWLDFLAAQFGWNTIRDVSWSTQFGEIGTQAREHYWNLKSVPYYQEEFWMLCYLGIWRIIELQCRLEILDQQFFFLRWGF